MTSGDSSPTIADFVLRYVEDVDGPGVRPIDDYVKLFPGAETEVRAEYDRLQSLAKASADLDRTKRMPTIQLDQSRKRIGNYRIEREIGRGGQGCVYLATDERLGRLVALKVVSLLRAESDALKRFDREAQVLAGLDHPAIAAVYDCGHADGSSYIAMRFVPGETLGVRLAVARDKVEPIRLEIDRTGETSVKTSTKSDESRSRSSARRVPRELIRFFEKIARALAHAHAAGIVHRDVKPQNIMVTPSGDPVILDFGLARPTDDVGGITMSGDFLGTPAYMAPEQVEPKLGKTDGRSDVYAVCVCLYECLTLTRPHQVSGRDALLSAIVHQDCPDVRSRDQGLSRDIAAVLARGLERDPDRRYKTADDLADDLAAILDGRPPAAKPITSFGKFCRRVQRNPIVSTLAFLSIVLVVSLSLAAGYIAAGRADRERGRAEREREEYERRLERAFLQLSEESSTSAAEAFKDLATRSGSASDEAWVGWLVATHWSGVKANESFDREWEASAPKLSARVAAAFDAVKRSLEHPTETSKIEIDPEDDDATSAFIRGTIALWQGERGRGEAFQVAVREFKKACLQAERPRPLYFMSLAHAASHAIDEPAARESAAVLTKRWPDSPEALFWAGYALAEFDPKATIAVADRVLSIDPRRPSALRMRGLASGEIGNLERTFADLERAIELSTDPSWRSETRANLVQAKIAVRDLPRARELLESLRRDAPDYTSLDHVSAHLALIEEDFEGAARFAEKAVARDSASVESWLLLAAAKASLGRSEDALGALKKVDEFGPGAIARHRVRRADVLAKLGRIDEAAAILEAATAENPRDFDASYRLGCILDEAGRFDAAAAPLERTLELRPDSLPARKVLHHALVNSARFEEADALTASFIEKFPNVADLYVDRAYGLFYQGLFPEAIRDMESVRGRFAADAAFQTAYGMLLAECGFIARAIDHFREFPPIDDPHAGKGAREFLTESDNVRREEAVYLELAAGRIPKPPRPGSAMNMADLAERRGDFHAALDLYELAKRLGAAGRMLEVAANRAAIAEISIVVGRGGESAATTRPVAIERRRAALARLIAALTELSDRCEDDATPVAARKRDYAPLAAVVRSTHFLDSAVFAPEDAPAIARARKLLADIKEIVY